MIWYKYTYRNYLCKIIHVSKFFFKSFHVKFFNKVHNYILKSIKFALVFLKSITQVFMEKSLKNYLLVIMLVHLFLRNSVFSQDKKNPPTCFVNVQVQFFQSIIGEKENAYHSPASKILHKKRHSSVIYTKKRHSSVKNCVISSVFSSVIFMEIWIYIYTVSYIMWWCKTGMLNSFYNSSGTWYMWGLYQSKSIRIWLVLSAPI